MSLSAVAHAATPVTMKISAPTTTVASGSTISLTIQVDAGSNQITAAQACISYDSSKLTLINIDTSLSSLPSVTPGSNTDCSFGQAQISRYAFNSSTKTVTPASDTFLLAVITFQAKQLGTTAAVTIDNAKSFIKDTSTITNGNYSNVLAGTSGTTLTLSSPKATPSPSVEQPSLTDKAHTVTSSGSASTLGQVASNGTRPSTALQQPETIIKPETKHPTAHTKVYLLSGLAILVLICTAMFIILSGTHRIYASSDKTTTHQNQPESNYNKKPLLLYVAVLAAIGVTTLMLTNATSTRVFKEANNPQTGTTNIKTYTTNSAASINDSDTSTPSIVIAAPFNSTTISGNYSVNVYARDTLAISKVEFSVDGDRVIATSTQAPYGFVLNTKNLSNGAHRVTASAYNAANNAARTTVNVIVNNTYTSDKNCNFNSDTVVDTSDLAILLANFNKTVSINTKGDCTNSGKVDVEDLFLLLGLFSR